MKAQMIISLGSASVFLLCGCHKVFGPMPAAPPALIAYCPSVQESIDKSSKILVPGAKSDPDGTDFIAIRYQALLNDGEVSVSPKLSDDQKKEYRNEIVSALESSIIISQQSFNGAATRHRQYLNWGTEVIGLGLTASTATVGGAAAKAAFGAAATGVTGVRTSFLSSFDDGIAKGQLIQTTADNNNANRLYIHKQLTRSYADYTLNNACADLAFFYSNGVLGSASKRFEDTPSALPTTAQTQSSATNQTQQPAAQTHP